MRRKVKMHDLVIYALFIAIFKPYFLPTVLQQGMKCVLILIVFIYIIANGKRKEIINDSIFFCACVILSGIVNYSRGMLQISNLFESILYAICIYCIFTLIEIVSRKDSSSVVLSLFRINSLYCILAMFDLFLPHTEESSGLTIYMWGGKFTMSYLFIMMISLFYVKNYNKIRNNIRWKISLVLLILLSIVYAWIVECSTALIAIGAIAIIALLRKKLKQLLLKPRILLVALIISCVFPFFADAIMQVDVVQKLVVGILGEGRGLSGRIALYDRYLLKVLSAHPYIGYGYGTTAMFNLSGFFGNTQNGLLDIIYKFGAIGAICFVVLSVNCFRKSKGTSRNIIISTLVYSIIVAGTVEVTYGWFYFFGIALVRWLDSDKKDANIYAPLYKNLKAAKL